MRAGQKKGRVLIPALHKTQGPQSLVSRGSPALGTGWAGDPCRAGVPPNRYHPIPCPVKDALNHLPSSRGRQAISVHCCQRMPWSCWLLRSMEEDASKTLWMPPGCLEPCLEFSSTCYNHYKNELAYSRYSEKSFHVFPCENAFL